MNRHVTTEDMQMASTLLAIKEMQITTKMKYYYTIIRVATTTKITPMRNANSGAEKQYSTHCKWDVKRYNHFGK